MMRIGFRIYRFLAVLYYTIPRRLTQAGLLAAAGALMTGAVGSDIDQSVAFQSFAFLFCILVVAAFSIPTFRGHFQAERTAPQLATVGQSFSYRVAVHNLSSRTFAGLEVLEELDDPRPSWEEFSRWIRPRRDFRSFRLAPKPGPALDIRPAIVKPSPLPGLTEGSTSDAQVEIYPLKRGPLRLSGVAVARRDPLGLVRSFVRCPLPHTILVLPKRYRLPAQATPGARNYQPGGIALASTIGESEEFMSLREYRPGDPFRRIHWRSWAKLGQPVVKEFQDEFFVRHGLILDTLGEIDPGSFEEAVSVAASFACTLETQESLLDLLFVGPRAFCFTAGRGLGRSQQMLEVLASVGTAPESQFEELRQSVMRHAPVLSSCICVFLNWDEARQDLVRRLQGFGLPVRVLVVANQFTEQRIRAQKDQSVPLHFLRPGSIEAGLQSMEKPA